MRKNSYVLKVPLPFDDANYVHVDEEDFCSVIEKISEHYEIYREEEGVLPDMLFIRSYGYIDENGYKYFIGAVYSDIALSVHITKN